MKKTAAPRIEIQLVKNPAQVDLKAVSALMATVKMQARQPAALARALKASSDIVVAMQGAQLVGFGRMVSDSVYYGTIWDVAVTPALQGQGVGKKIMEVLLRQAKKRKLYMGGLFTATHNRQFYERLGLKFLEDVHAVIFTDKLNS